MKASATAAKARQDSAHRKAPPAKPTAKPAVRARAKTVPAVVKKATQPVAAKPVAAKPVAARSAAAKPVAARAAAAATAVATKSAPPEKKAVPQAAPKQHQAAAAVEAPAKPAVTAPAMEVAKQPAAEPAPLPATAKQPAAKPATEAAKPAPAAEAAKPATLAKPPAAVANPAALRPPPSAAHPPARPASEPTVPATSPAAAPPAAETAAAIPAQVAAARSPADAARRPGGPGMHTGPITTPRPMAKAEVFHEGDHVVYPTHGVGKVERIATEEIAGHKLELIHITFEENRMTLRVPVAKARTAGLRKLATRKLFDEALNVLKGRARIKRTMWSRRAQEYEAKINSGDPLAIAEVVRDLHRNAGQPDQSFSERQIYEAAMERLAAELAALDKTDKATAATKLTDFLKTV